ncbi:unnamed protein product [Merluccius merluccius]
MLSGRLLVVSFVVASCWPPPPSDAAFLRGTAGARPVIPGSKGPPAAAAETLTWTFPQDPVPVAPVTPRRFESQRPAAAPDRVAVRCGEGAVGVEVSQDLLGTGRLVRPEELTLGGCGATLADDSSRVLTFWSPLHGCNSRLIMTDDRFIYAFRLVYRPKPWRHVGIMRTADAEVGVECHYPRGILTG